MSESKVAIVTGAAQGIGLAIATELARAGWRVVGVDRNPVPTIAGVRGVVADVGDEAAVRMLVEGVAAREGRLDAIVSNAGRMVRKPLAQLTLAEWSGVLATNLAGPRRVRAGAARDHFLGFAAVNGRGEIWKAGGKVVKNVTGYDLCKLQAGAYGTLSVLTELSIRVLPRPEQECSVLLVGLDDAAAIAALAAALNTPHEVSSAAHLPEAVAARSGVRDVAGAGGSVTILRLEGPGPSVAWRAAELRAGRESLRLENDASVAVWAEVGAVQPLLAQDDSLVWRVCPTPSSAPAVLRAVRAGCPSADAYYDWGGGLLWIALDPAEAGADCGALLVRGAVARAGGHAMLLRAPAAARATVGVFEPAPAALDALARRVKSGFDPGGVLNPGRMQENI